MDKTPLERAVAEWRQSHPDDDDLPDEALESLTYVRMRALGIAGNDFGRAMFDAVRAALGRIERGRRQ